MCALLVCLLSFLLLLLLLLFVHLPLPYLHASPPPLLAESFYLFHFLLFFFTHPLSFLTLSLPHSDLLDAIFPLFFSLMMKSSLGRLLTSFVAFTHTLLLSGFPSVRISTLPFPRLLLSSLIPSPLSLFLALPSVAFLRWTIASWSP